MYIIFEMEKNLSLNLNKPTEPIPLFDLYLKNFINNIAKKPAESA